MSSRQIQEAPCAYRVRMELFGKTFIFGPYSTEASAKAKRTNLRYHSSGVAAADMVVTIEKTPDGWETVDV